VLYSTEPLLLGCSNENPITKDRCGGVTMKGIETKYDQKCACRKKTQKFFSSCSGLVAAKRITSHQAYEAHAPGAFRPMSLFIIAVFERARPQMPIPKRICRALASVRAQ
jgi:hypothetical protein